jgi:hypothetical protein
MITGTGGAGGADSSTTPGAPVITLFDVQADLKTCAQKNHSRFHITVEK